MLQQDALSFSLAVDRGDHFFRDARPSFGRTRVSPSRRAQGIAIAGTCLPNQMLMVFDSKDPTREPRLVLGRESLLLQGFPIDFLKDMELSLIHI